MKRKLIEVALPLETINRESAREKSIRHGHPSTLHLWWARRPLAAARAVLFAQLVDDPSARTDEFPTEDAQRAERERLHGIIERLVVWENIRDERLLAEARAEIIKSCDGNPPPILDPFAGGGTIPLEAQRLGLEAHASDLNPVAVLINKALIELPPKFRDQRPVFPGLADSEVRIWKGVEGLAADVRAYGAWMRDEAEQRLSHLYPQTTLPDGSRAPVIAWVWARTVTCPNPACRIEMPLVRSWWLSKKKGREAFVVPQIVGESSHPSGVAVKYLIGSGPLNGPRPESDGTIRRSGATCVSCETNVPLAYIREQGQAKRIGRHLLAVVARGKRQRVYIADDGTHAKFSQQAEPRTGPVGTLDYDPRAITAPNYGMTEIADLFTPRQLTALQTFSDLVQEAGERLVNDGGTAEYASAVVTYLAMTVSRLVDLGNSLCRWEPNAECPRQLFGRQAIPMVWDFAEGNPLGSSSGSWVVLLEGANRAFLGAGFNNGRVASGLVRQASAVDRDFEGFVISTDPPYYDNVPYSSLSDFFYVWLRESLRTRYPELLATLQVPKAEELVASPFRQGGKAEARAFFESGFRRVFAEARKSAPDEFPMTVYYAFKQSETTDLGDASTGWETLLEGMIASGWRITATWPVRTETASRMRGQNSNALGSSIVLSLRPRSQGSSTTDRRGLIGALQSELPDALRKLQQGAIAPVDLPQAAIGPGMAVFTRFAKVLEPDGSQMTVRSALARINEILDQVLSEQEGDFDSTTRFAIAWYRQHGYSTGKFGDADNLARARNTSVERMDRDEILTSRAGMVTLVKPADTPTGYDVLADDHTSSWEALHHSIRILETEGVPAAGAFMATARRRPDGAVDLDLIKELAFLLFSIAEKNGWTKDAISFNAVAQSWSDVVDASKAAPRDEQGKFTYSEEDN